MILTYDAYRRDDWGSPVYLGVTTLTAKDEDEGNLAATGWAHATWPGSDPIVTLLLVTEVQWPRVFPELPEALLNELSLWYRLVTDARARMADPQWPGSRDIAYGQACSYEGAAENLVQVLTREMYWGEGTALRWVDER